MWQEENQDIFGGDASSFVDFLLSLVAIMIVALSLSREGLDATTNQLRYGNLTRDFILETLRCGVEGAASGKVEHCKNTFSDGGKTVSFFIPKGEPVLVLADVNDMNATPPGRGVFPRGNHVLQGAANEAIEALRARIDVVFPCFAPSDGSKVAKLADDESCETVFTAARAYADTFGKVVDELSDLATIELFVIEGHSDAERLTRDNSDLPAQRANMVLFRLLGAVSDRRIDNVGQLLDALANEAVSATSPLSHLVPVRERLIQQCAITAPSWCKNIDEPWPDNASEVVRTAKTNLSKIFAAAAFGRFSLRFPDRESSPNPRNRRVEFRLIMATVPGGMFELQENEPGTAYVDLFSSSVVEAFRECDNHNRSTSVSPIADCASQLNAVVAKGDGGSINR
ncbi:hypothetical protein RLEG3_12350 [Rhizobium leguminosarum bv. trifolii WSM1689]|nr:hypothetical protein RLEG3_12350 [Rhizobium leguminosarum bv. trifolii WSM1689]